MLSPVSTAAAGCNAWCVKNPETPSFLETVSMFPDTPLKSARNADPESLEVPGRHRETNSGLGEAHVGFVSDRGS